MGPCKKCMKSAIAYSDAASAMHGCTGVDLDEHRIHGALFKKEKKKVTFEGPTLKWTFFSVVQMGLRWRGLITIKPPQTP